MHVGIPLSPIQKVCAQGMSPKRRMLPRLEIGQTMPTHLLHPDSAGDAPAVRSTNEQVFVQSPGKSS
jgi:hypothetical protein